MARILSLKLSTPTELAQAIAERARAKRLRMNLSQAGLAARAGVSLGSLKRFERTGEIAFVSLLRLAYALDSVSELDRLFPEVDAEPSSIEAIIRSTRSRHRGRKK